MNIFTMPEPVAIVAKSTMRVDIGWRVEVPSNTRLYTTDQVREVLEQAAKICDGVDNFANPLTAGDCADAIRDLKEQLK